MIYRPKRAALDPCPVEAVLAIVAGKWKARILLELSREPSGFAALRRRLPGIAQQVLSAQLAALEDHGVVSRTPSGPGLTAGSVYALNDEGSSLMPVLDDIAEWGAARLQREALTVGELWSGRTSPRGTSQQDELGRDVAMARVRAV